VEEDAKESKRLIKPSNGEWLKEAGGLELCINQDSKTLFVGGDKIKCKEADEAIE